MFEGKWKIPSYRKAHKRPSEVSGWTWNWQLVPSLPSSYNLSCPQEAEAILDTRKGHRLTEPPGKDALQPVELHEYAVCSVFPAFMSRHPCWDKVLVMQLFGKIISVPLKNPNKTCWRLSILWSVVGSLLGVCDIHSHIPENSTKLQFPNHLTLRVHTIAKGGGAHRTYLLQSLPIPIYLWDINLKYES